MSACPDYRALIAKALDGLVGKAPADPVSAAQMRKAVIARGLAKGVAEANAEIPRAQRGWTFRLPFRWRLRLSRCRSRAEAQEFLDAVRQGYEQARRDKELPL